MSDLPDLHIDWGNVSWLYVAVLALFVFVSTLIGTLLSFRRVLLGSVFSAVLFAAAFVFWTYYPHGLPLPTSVTARNAAAKPAAPPPQVAPSAQVKPDNPVTTLPPDPSPQPGNAR